MVMDSFDWHEAGLTVGQVAQRSGAAPSALRFYERQGLINADRTASNQRRYGGDVLCRVAMIRVCQQAGLSLAQIRAALAEAVPTAGFPARKSGNSWQPTSGERLPAASANWTVCSAHSAGKRRPRPAIVHRTQRCPPAAQHRTTRSGPARTKGRLTGTCRQIGGYRVSRRRSRCPRR